MDGMKLEVIVLVSRYSSGSWFLATVSLIFQGIANRYSKEYILVLSEHLQAEEIYLIEH